MIFSTAGLKPPRPSDRRAYIKTLQRRHAFLLRRNGAGSVKPKTINFDQLEAASLRWAIMLMEQENDLLNMYEKLKTKPKQP